MSSGTAAMIFDARADGVEILSDQSWEACIHPSFSTAPIRPVNHRLSESNIRYDARRFPADWYKGGVRLGNALEIGVAPGKAPLGALVERPIPMWKDYGMKDFVSRTQSNDTLYCRLPYNCHFNPYLKVEAPEGRVISMITDHDVVTGEKCVSAEYVTCKGVQEYETFGWLSGELLMYIVPSDVKVLDVKFRETSYDTEFSASFECDDPFLNDYWTKARRTMLVCMRDTYYDCPDRERAQWWGDEVNELNEAFYLFDRKSDLLARKGILELVNWQKADGVLYAPVPCSNYYKELPLQILNSVGWYGFHNFYWYSGDDSFISEVYDPVHKYLHEVWQLDQNGMPIYRVGAWDWPDAGAHQDGLAQLQMWYYLALKAEIAFAQKLGRTEDIARDKEIMDNIAEKFNALYWNGSEYKSPGHTDVADDRVQALAVIAGVATPDKYEALKKVFSEQFHATTYMTPYVLDALYTMGEPQMAIDRMKKLYPTVMKDDCSTIYEHWNFDGTNNHAWAGGAVISMNRQLAGVEALAPGYQKFTVAPQMAKTTLKWLKTSFETNYGMISVSLERKGRKNVMATITVPEGTSCEVTLASGKPATLAPGTHTVKL
jgi:Bacterial alpha-L-rhamnosidase.